RLLGDARATEEMAALEHEHGEPGPREIAGGREAVVAAADDDHVARSQEFARHPQGRRETPAFVPVAPYTRSRAGSRRGLSGPRLRATIVARMVFPSLADAAVSLAGPRARR